MRRAWIEQSTHKPSCKIMLFSIVNRSFLLICVVTTVALTIFCIYQYSRDEDVSLISFKKYHEDEDSIYPAITLCFTDYLNGSAFKDNVSEAEYKKFMKGLSWSHEMSKIDYDDVIIDINEYILAAIQTFHNEEDDEWGERSYFPKNGITHWMPIFYSSLSLPEWKCWTFEIDPSEQNTITGFGLIMKSNIFKDSIRKPFGNFQITLSYPNQFIGANVQKYNWMPMNYDQYRMEFEIENVVILRQRQKQNNPCNDDWKNNDELARKRFVEAMGCIPVFVNYSATVPKCTNHAKYGSVIKTHGYSSAGEPCRRVEKVMYSYNEYQMYSNVSSLGVSNTTKMFEIGLLFQGNTFMLIEQTKSYDYQALIGNAGGYVGLFLGAALMQLPTAVRRLLIFFKKLYENIKQTSV